MMDDLTKGSWIINSIKHFEKFQPSTPELQFFEATEIAGKAGLLLSKMVADTQEIIPGNKIRAFARLSGMRSTELPTVLSHLRREGKADFSSDDDDNITEVEVYCFSAEDALRTTCSVHERLSKSSEEESSIVSLDATFRLPYYEDDLLDMITKAGFDEKTAKHTLKLQSNLELIGIAGEGRDSIYHNEYAFAENPEKVAKALKSLKPQELSVVQDVLKILEDNPGYPFDHLTSNFSSDILDMMEGVGLFDTLVVQSPVGDAAFVTTPQLQGISISRPILSADVFHKVKLLLSCLRFGESKSTHSRGRIESFTMMMNIVRKLNRGEEVGPCTAISEDYQLLEAQGVIKTRSGYGNTRYMLLRQLEVGQLVAQMLEYHMAIPEAATAAGRLLDQPLAQHITPEGHRPVQAKMTKGTREARARLLHAIRT